MKIIKQYFEFPFGKPDGEKILRDIEIAGRVCYKSEDKMTPTSHYEFVKKAIASGHHSIIEHPVITVRVITDRGVTHEIVRHRIASYSQESTRYCNYSTGKFGNEITVILPVWFYYTEEYNNAYRKWLAAMNEAEMWYMDLLHIGQSAQQARAVLPNSLKTEIIMTYNIREWRHFFNLRNSEKAHPQMKHLAAMIHDEFKQLVPILFDEV